MGIKGVIFALILAAVLPMHRARGQDCTALTDYDVITRTVTERFYDKTFRGLDWPARVSAHRRDVKCGASAGVVAVEVNKLLSELHASHTALYTPADIDYWGLNSFFGPTESYPLNFAGIWPEKEGGAWYAKYVFEGSPAARAGVAKGDALKALNGHPFSITGFTGAEDKLIVSSDGETSRTATIKADHESVVKAFIDGAEHSRQVLSIAGKPVGYFHLWTARDQILASLKESIRAFEGSGVSAVIIDLRGGYGGTSEDYLNPIRESAYLSKRPKVFLIDDGVRSGKEMLAAIIKRDKLGALIGSKTSGAFLGAAPIRLLNDRYFLLLAVAGGATRPDLPPIEGVGVQPDLAVEPCRAICAGKDVQLQAATRYLSDALRADAAIGGSG